MKILSGRDLAGFIKERQAKQVRSLVQSAGIQPKLVIFKTIDDPAIDVYVRLKKKYGADIGVEVELIELPQEELAESIRLQNENDQTSGIIVQLPLQDNSQQEEMLNSIIGSKDVDGLAEETSFEPATPKAIEWLLDGYNIQLDGKKITILGKGRLVGAPLYRLFSSLGYDVTALDKEDAPNLKEVVSQSDVIISGTGSAGLVTSDMVKNGAVAIDAGVAVESGQTVGDFAEDMYTRGDLTISPKRGGVGPLTVSALFENVILAASRSGDL